MKTIGTRTIFFLVCILACWVFPSSILASVEVDGIFYELNTSAKTAAVTSNPDKYTGAIDIPSSFDYNGDTYNVKSISSLAFLNCSEMTTINFPSSVTSIGSSAFERCAGLTDVVIGSGVTLIDYEAFKNCSNLRSLTLPSSLKTIENETFSGCTSLVEIIAKRTTPPTIVNTTFDGVDKTACIVYVPDGCQSTYAKAANWKAFSNIIERTVVATGSCGDNVTYTIYSDMTMVISGTGPMCDYFIGVIEEGEIEVNYNTRENDEYWSKVTNVMIEEGVTSISEYAFSYCTDLVSIAIPNSVTSIGAFSFLGCSNLTTITISPSVAVIGDCAFSFSGLTHFTIEDSGDELLFGSSSGSGIEFFEECPLEYVYMGRNIRTNNPEGSIDQLIRWGSVTYPPFSGQSSLTTLVIGDNVTTLEDYSFSGAPLHFLVIGKNVQTLGMYALSSANIGETISIPSNVTRVGDCCFSPYISQLVIEKGDNDLELYGGAYSTELSLFGNNSENEAIVESVYVGRNLTYSTYARNKFVSAYIDAELTSIPETVEYDDEGRVAAILSYKYSPIVAKNIYFEDDGAVGPYYFNESGVEHIYNLNPSKVGDHAFAKSGVKTVTFNVNGSTTIASNMFEGCRGLTSLTIPEGVTEIGYCAFDNCINLESVKIPNSVTTIRNAAFFDCKLSDFFAGPIPAQIDETTFGFWGSDGEEEEPRTEVEHILHVPFGCKSLYENAEYWDYFDSIIEDGGNLEILATGPCGDNLTYTIYSNMTMAISGTGEMQDFSSDIHINDDYYQSIQKVIIEEGVTSIGNWAFEKCTGLTSVTIPNSVTKIGDAAFYDCASLTSLDIPASVNEIGEGAFYGCSELTSMVIPDSVKVISPVLFSNCTGLTSVTLPKDLTEIGNEAFVYCSSLDSVAIPSSVTVIGDAAFVFCSSLTSINIPNSVTYIGYEAFYNTAWYNNQPDGLVYAGNVAYEYKGEMHEGTSITIRNGTVSISGHAFSGCTGLTSVTLPNSMTNIGEYAFRDCSRLTSLTIPNGMIGIARFAFFQCTGLTSISIPRSVTGLGESAFGGCANLNSITVKSNIPIDLGIRGQFRGVDKEVCTLYVPIGSKSAYKNASGWSAFENIVEVEFDTDLSTLDNAIYVEQTEGRIGGTMDIPVKIKSINPFRGFAFTMELPEGSTINSWALSSGRLPSGATTSDKVATQKIDGNKIAVSCALNYGKEAFTGNDGEVATVNVTFAEDMEVGEYPIYLTACDISDAGGTDKKLSDIKATLVLEDYVEGDANGDGVVLIGDVIAILNYIVGVTSNNFNEKAADVNGDGEILIGDVIAVLNIIVSQ